MQKYVIAVLLLISVVTFSIYALDKGRARRGAWRISEKALLTLSFLGGATGGMLAMLFIRHKTKHWYFWAVNIISLALHIALIIFSSQMNIF